MFYRIFDLPVLTAQQVKKINRYPRGATVRQIVIIHPEVKK